ncbi:MAG: PhzF family phenazine biosynthesis protein [Coxiellaceae bacterium]|nr:MAG: PhzF family phenazine biosynthesis protein [Coxiellaceae bacterium]
MKIKLYQLDAFAEQLFSGNPAAVCPLPYWLPDNLLQAIAAENNLSETAFLVPQGDDFRLRWFTPVREVSLCGHATLAAAYVVFQFLKPATDQVVFHTLSGALRVTQKGSLLTMQFPALSAEQVTVSGLLVEALGVTPVAVYRSLDYMLVLASESQVRDLRPDLARLLQLDLRGVVVTAPGEQYDFVSRYFAPKLAIPEDPVTGSTHCVLAPYWGKRLGKDRLCAKQLSARGGVVLCELQDDTVALTGNVIPYLLGEITLPD